MLKFWCKRTVFESSAMLKALLLLWFVGLADSTLSWYQCFSDSTKKDECLTQKHAMKSLMPDNSTIYYHPKDQFTVPKVDNKYFRECWFDQHRDGRYGTYSSGRKETLLEILNVFIEFAREKSLPYWIAHGGLIGWFWNNKMLPWDSDIDIQVLYYDLEHSYTKYKNVLYKDRYLVDINPNSKYRVHQQMNVIDARFIDTFNGLYIDITGLVHDGMTGKLYEKTPKFYTVEQIFPLHETVLEGLNVWIPHHVMDVLKQEFGEKVFHWDHYISNKQRFGEYTWGGIGWKYDPAAHLWVVDKEAQISWWPQRSMKKKPVPAEQQPPAVTKTGGEQGLRH